MGVAGLALLVTCYFVGCGTISTQGMSDDDSDHNANWFCQEYNSDCECSSFPSGTTLGGYNEVDRCGAYDCCMYSNGVTEDVEATCTCLITEATCEQEAATRPGAEVVATCPPGAEPVEVLCAANGESCRSDYLRQKGFEGCCEGTLCRQDANGIPICQAASAEDLALYARCHAQSQDNSELTDLQVQPNTLVTSHGELTLEGIDFVSYSTGPGGCLNGFRISVGDLGCGLDFVGSVVDGVLAVTDVSGFLDECPGLTGAGAEYVESAPEIVTAFSFAGLSCDDDLIFESYCVAGAFTFTLGGTVGDLTFEPQTLRVEGAMCSPSGVSGTCPSSG